MSQLNNFTIDQLVSFSAQNSKALSYFGMCKRQEVFVQECVCVRVLLFRVEVLIITYNIISSLVRLLRL